MITNTEVAINEAWLTKPQSFKEWTGLCCYLKYHFKACKQPTNYMRAIIPKIISSELNLVAQTRSAVSIQMNNAPTFGGMELNRQQNGSQLASIYTLELCQNYKVFRIQARCMLSHAQA
jgi:hypothetical protein